MKKVIYIGLSCFAFYFSHSIFAMENSINRQKIELPYLNPELCIPPHLTLLEPDEPICDELLLTLNPEWQKVKEIVDQEPGDPCFIDFQANLKFLKFRIAAYATGYYPRIFEENYHALRTLIALAATTITDLHDKNKYMLADRPVYMAMKEDDVPLADFLVKKGFKPAKKDFWTCKSIALTNLLLNAGIKFPKHMLVLCIATKGRSTEQMQLLFDKGFKPSAHKKTGLTPLHQLMHNWFTPHGIAKAHFLLSIGQSPHDRTDKQATVLHCAVEGMLEEVRDWYHTRYNNRIKPDSCSRWCIFWVDYFLEKHRVILEVLHRIKTDCPRLYKLRTDLLKPYLIKMAHEPMQELRDLLWAHQESNTAQKLLDIDESRYDLGDEFGLSTSRDPQPRDNKAIEFTKDLIELLDHQNCTYGKRNELSKKIKRKYDA